MKNFLFAALLGFSALASNAAMAEAPTAPQVSETCKKNVLFELNGINYAVPRTKTTSYYRLDGTYVKSTDPTGPAMDCTVSNVGPVSGFTTGFINTRDYDIQLRLKGGQGMPTPPVTTYQEVKLHIEEGIKNLKFERLKDGTRTFTYGETTIYVLPRNIAITQSPDKEPVTVICKVDRITAKLREEQDKRSSNSSKNRALYGRPIDEKDKVTVPHVCHARYLHAGTSFGYTYYEFEPGDHLALDFYLRKRLENLKVQSAAAQPSTPPATP